jgi:hypothetical protein
MSIADKNFNGMGSTSVHRIRSIHRELPERLFRGSIQQQLASSYLKQQLANSNLAKAATCSNNLEKRSSG